MEGSVRMHNHEPKITLLDICSYVHCLSMHGEGEKEKEREEEGKVEEEEEGRARKQTADVKMRLL